MQSIARIHCAWRSRPCRCSSRLCRQLASSARPNTTGCRGAAPDPRNQRLWPIAHSQHHLHGAYIVENSDLAGFTRHEQQVLAAILRNHRRKPDEAVLRPLPERLRRPTARVTALLRLAVLLQRGRAADPPPPIELLADDKLLQLKLPRAWLDAHPLTETDLDQERDYLKQFDIKLQVRDSEKMAAA